MSNNQPPLSLSATEWGYSANVSGVNHGLVQLNRTIFWYFLKLGWLAFGGPVGQIGLMHLQVVERQKWLDEEEFVRALNFCHLLPGPEALQLAIYIGYRKGGYAAGAMAGILFILPGFLTLSA